MQRLIILAIIIIVPVITAGYYFNTQAFSTVEANSSYGVTLTPERERHILYGDSRGGGHKAGINKPCKSEFPENWSDEQILDTTRQIAANDNLNWKRGHNGYYVAENMVNSIKVRVVVNREKREIVTAYPINVVRNPCPTPANDNRR